MTDNTDIIALLKSREQPKTRGRLSPTSTSISHSQSESEFKTFESTLERLKNERYTANQQAVSHAENVRTKYLYNTFLTNSKQRVQLNEDINAVNHAVDEQKAALVDELQVSCCPPLCWES